jgi:hypothetical protein
VRVLVLDGLALLGVSAVVAGAAAWDYRAGVVVFGVCCLGAVALAARQGSGPRR